MKIGVVSTYDTRCGLAFYIRGFLREWRKDNEIKVFSEENRPGVRNLPPLKDVPYEKVWNRRKRSFHDLYESLAEYDPDISYFMYTPAFFGRDQRFIDLIKRVSRDSRTVINLEGPRNPEYWKRMGADQFHLFVYEDVEIPNLIQFPFPAFESPLLSREEARRDIDQISDQDDVAIVTGFIRKKTGVSYIINAFEDVVASDPDSVLIFGGGSHPDDEENIWIERGKKGAREADLLNDRIFFTESSLSEKALNKLGSAADIFIDYRKDSPHSMFSGNAMRAVSYRLPAVMYDGPNVNHIRKGCIKVGSAQELADGILRLFNDEKLYARKREEMEDLYQKRRFSKIARRALVRMEEIL